MNFDVNIPLSILHRLNANYKSKLIVFFVAINPNHFSASYFLAFWFSRKFSLTKRDEFRRRIALIAKGGSFPVAFKSIMYPLSYSVFQASEVR
jgi:hypothetical protein